MARYIDVDALKKDVLKWLPSEFEERPFEEDICVSMMMTIEEQPIADVHEIIHAKWIHLDREGILEDGKTVRLHDPVNYRCSNCGGLAGIRENFLYPHNIHDLLYPICPHCSAIMDK